MLSRYSDEQLRLAARLYYLDGLGQSEVPALPLLGGAGQHSPD